MNWFEADDYCKGEGGKLVEIESEEENKALVEVIKRREFKDRNFWIGLTDRKSEGDWRLESSGLRPLYKNWGSSEPDGGHNENCAQIWNKYLTWSDVPCDIDNTSLWSRVEYKTFHALCEFQESGEQNSPQTSIRKKIFKYSVHWCSRNLFQEQQQRTHFRPTL